MPSVRPGDTAPDFRLPSTDGDVSLDGLLEGGRRLVLAFYVEDGTPTCQTELAMLRDAHQMIRDFNTGVVAISADTLDAHRAFAARLGGLSFPLASDIGLVAARAYGVIDEGDPRRARRALFVIGADRNVMLAVVPFQPSNLSQVEAIFAVLGAEN